MPRDTARYLVTATVAHHLPRENECNERQQTLLLTLEEAFKADVIGLPVLLDFNVHHRVGTVISSFVDLQRRTWTLNMALVVTREFAADELLTGPWSAVAPIIRILTRAKAIEGFSIVQSQDFTGSKITRVQLQRITI